MQSLITVGVANTCPIVKFHTLEFGISKQKIAKYLNPFHSEIMFMI